MRKRSRHFLPLFFLTFFTSCLRLEAQSVTASENIAAARPSFGEKLSVNGLPNAGRVDTMLYRGAQPRAAAFPELKKLGITTIVDLREEHPEKIAWERQQAEAAGLHFINIPVNGWTPPTHAQVAQFLALMRGHPDQKILVHCRFGEDRTGVFVAVYRIALNGWTAEQAVREMYYFGFNGSWHRNMQSYVLTFPASLHSAPALASLAPLAPGGKP